MSKIQNHHDTYAEKTDKEFHDEKIRALVLKDLERSQQPFSMRFALPYAMANAVQYALHGFLGLGAAAGISILVAGHGGHWGLWALGFAFGAVGGTALEVFKHKSQTELWYGIFYLKKIKPGVLLGALGAASLSSLAVLPAAKLLPEVAAPEAKSPELVTMDSTFFKAELARIDSTIKLYELETRKSSSTGQIVLRKGVREQIDKLLNERRTVTEHWNEQVEKADDQNKKKQEDHDEEQKEVAKDLEGQSFWSMWFSVALEGLLLGVSAWTWFYRFRCLSERPEMLQQHMQQVQKTPQPEIVLQTEALILQQTEQHEPISKQVEAQLQEIKTSYENELHALRNALRTMEEKQQEWELQQNKNENTNPEIIIRKDMQWIRNDNEKADKEKRCEHCDTPFVYKTTWQKYCSGDCRIAAYESRTGKNFKR